MSSGFFQSFMMADKQINNFNNIFQQTQNLSTLQTVYNDSIKKTLQVEAVSFDEISRKFAATLEPMFIRLTNGITLLRQEVKSLRKEVSELKQDRYNIKLVIPQQPFQTMKDFLNFEKQLQEDPNLFASFASEMELKTVGKKPNFTKNCWRKLLVDELAEKLCWKGTEKKSVRSLNASKSIRNAAIAIGIGEDEFIRNTKSFFQFAKNRKESKEKYKSKKISSTVISNEMK
ncbi:uncharacterized protein LOC125776362 [Bactrocera dorsalis]|uniref:Uncharacterized protein LOC125776362 n=1 Tax=Bactrocera dorsalis TaxID=27457 RepID=A0ABM3J4D1_BACDO|nr:uncharacterized protein LOC125776362 [Bactrocera dorsalis]